MKVNMIPLALGILHSPFFAALVRLWQPSAKRDRKAVAVIGDGSMTAGRF